MCVKDNSRRGLVRSLFKGVRCVERRNGERLMKKADSFRMERRRRRTRWADCVERDLAGVGGVENESKGSEGVETGGGVGSEGGSVAKKKEQKSATGIGASLTPGFMSNQKYFIVCLKAIGFKTENSLQTHPLFN